MEDGVGVERPWREDEDGEGAGDLLLTPLPLLSSPSSGKVAGWVDASTNETRGEVGEGVLGFNSEVRERASES